MSQTTTGVGTKITGNTYTAAEFNAVNGAVNANAADALSKGETSDQAMASNVDFTSGKGVQFDGGTVLTDYEEGEFVITVTPKTSGSFTLTNDTFSYTKIGRLVTITGQFNIASSSSPVGDSITIGPLPFASANLTDAAGRASISISYNIPPTPLNSVLPSWLNESSTVFEATIDASTITATDQFYLSFSYVTSA